MSKLHQVSTELKTDRDGDVIFVHGLGGHPFDTWRSSKKKEADVWPRWLADDLFNIAVWTLEYDASPSRWLGESMPLIDRAKQVAHLLGVEELGKRPLLFVGHSLGGILIKQILRTCDTQGIDAWRNIVEHTQGVVFLATPHTGADLATWLDRLRVILRPGSAAQDLKADHPALRDLGQWYSNKSIELRIDTLCFYETQKTNGVLVVDPGSANPGISGVEPIAADTDHLSICKCQSQDDVIYKSVKQFVVKAFDSRQSSKESVVASGHGNEDPTPAKLFISYRRSARNDSLLAKFLYEHLRSAGHDVFIDTQIPVGTEWTKEISDRIEWCDYLVVLLSEDSITSEAVQSEVRHASHRRRKNELPMLFPVRVAYDGPLGYELDMHLHRYQYIRWRMPEDNECVLNDINAVLHESSKGIAQDMDTIEISIDQCPSMEIGARPQPVVDPRILRLPGGTVRMHDPLYLYRPADKSVIGNAQLSGETMVIKGPRQMGKSSLLIRYLDACRETGKRIAYIDFQCFQDSILDQYETFLHALVERLASKLKVKIDVQTFSPDGCQLEFDRFVTKKLLGTPEVPTTLAFDEVDRLLGRNYQGSFFSMLRSWHNARAEFSSVWENVDLALVISTEPYLLIDTADQSPFNITPPVELQPFARDFLDELNEKFGLTLTATELDELHEFLGGQPYLTRLAFYRISVAGDTFRELIECGANGDGPFGDHLRTLLMRLDQVGLRMAMRKVISGSGIDDETYYRLHRIGLVRKEYNRIQPANMVYARFFQSLQ